MITILSLDGGGIRGIISATVLEEIEKRTGRPISDMFDYIAGTSTGGILACVLTAPDRNGRPKYTAKEVRELYIELGGAVFRRSIARQIRTLGGLAGPRYSSKTLEKYLDDYLGNVRLSAALTNIIVPVFETRDSVPYFFKSAFAKPFAPEWENPPLKLAALATAAAPTYFPPVRIGEKCFVDGGIFANNPALCAYADAKRAYPDETEFLAVSLGTGIHIERFSCRNLKNRGLAGWLPIILRMLQNSSSLTVHYQMRTFLGKDRYREFQILLPASADAMDNASPENIDRLCAAGRELIKEKSRELNEICRVLQNHKRRK